MALWVLQDAEAHLDSLVSGDWLIEELGSANLRLIDASYFLPGDGRDARAEFAAGHIPGARFLDLESLADPDHPSPNMLPPSHLFASRMRALGVGASDRVVLYDNSPHRSAARAWWMLRSFGIREAAILDGGMQKWVAEGRPLEPGIPEAANSAFSARLDESELARRGDVLAAQAAGEIQIVDARSARRFAGMDAEPRAGVAPGHIPGSRSLPHGQLFEADNSFKRGEALRAAFEDAGVDLRKPMIATCGSGITAAVLLFAAHLLGKQDVTLYDGSWAEWGADPSTPKATGPA